MPGNLGEMYDASSDLCGALKGRRVRAPLWTLRGGNVELSIEFNTAEYLNVGLFCKVSRKILQTAATRWRRFLPVEGSTTSSRIFSVFLSFVAGEVD